LAVLALALGTLAAAFAVSAQAKPTHAKAKPGTTTALLVSFDKAAPAPAPMPLGPRGYPHGAQVVKLDVDGNAIDAHADYIAHFGHSYFLWGESYGCTYEYSQFCGFRVYQSRDLMHWKSRGKILDPATSDFARRMCGPSPTYCLGPVVIYNRPTHKYRLWFYRQGGGVVDNIWNMESDSPLGPWVNPIKPAAFPPCHCVFDIFQERSGTAYISYTVLQRGHFNLRTQRLNDSYTDAVGPATVVTDSAAGAFDPQCLATGGFTGLAFAYETPEQIDKWRNCGLLESTSMLRKGSRYYLTFGAICAYCLGTDTSYFVARSPLGPWTGVGGSPSSDPAHPGVFHPYRLSNDTCGGQPFHVSHLPTADGRGMELFTTELWQNSRNEGNARSHWEQLRFTRDRLLAPLRCAQSAKVPLAEPVRVQPAPPKAVNICAAGSGNVLKQTLTAPVTGRLTSVDLSLYRRTRPSSVFGRFANAPEQQVTEPLTVELSNGDKHVTRQVLPDAVPWSATRFTLALSLHVRRGDHLALSTSSPSPGGCYGTLFEAHNPYPAGHLIGHGGVAEPAVPTASLARPSTDLLFSASIEHGHKRVRFGSWS